MNSSSAYLLAENPFEDPFNLFTTCHVDEYTATRQQSGGAAEMRGGSALDFRYNWSCLVRA
jgi:hypothetical protein